MVLSEETDVPIVLPNNPADTATILISEPEVYLVAFTPAGCAAEESDCVTASMLGRTLATAYAQVGGEAVALDDEDKTTALYFPFDPTEPSNAFLYWVIGDYRYELTMFNATREEMLEVANSAYAEQN